MEEKVIRAGETGPTFRLVVGDALDLLDQPALAGAVDLVVTSPPYNIGVNYGNYDDSAPRDEYLAWVDAWAARLRRVLSDSASFFLNVGAKPSDPWVPFEVAAVLRKHFTLQNVIHWIKSIVVEREDIGKGYGKARDFVAGHYKPVQSKRFLTDLHEYVFHWTKTGAVELERLALGVPYKDKSNVSRWKAARADLRCRGNVWFVPYETIRSRRDQRPHPSTFPVKLARMCIRLAGRQNVGLVLDPFMGIGNAAVACVLEGRSFLGIDIDPAYVDEAARRVTEAL
ncbi:MAG: site-specific DNA-methyltransferase, partial [Planctomycetota bacterium]